MHECSFELNDKPMSAFRMGLIPPGIDYIFDRPSGGLLGPLQDLFNDHSYWFALYAIDGKIDDETYCNKVKREPAA